MSFLVRYASPPKTADECRIPLTHGRSALVDSDDFEYLSQFKWYCRMSSCCWYAVRKKWIDGKCTFIRMHREVMHTPEDQECHHHYCDTLDNRKAMLQNVTPEEHKEIHRTKIFTEGSDQQLVKDCPF